MRDAIIFCKDKWLFELTVPEYETDNFGYKVSELKLVDTTILDDDVTYPFDALMLYMREQEIRSCTFRGKEDIKIIQCLNQFPFKFIGTFTSMYCRDYELQEIDRNENYHVVKATYEDAEEILSVEYKVFDYSSYQIDDRFPNNITAKRNVKRVESYFNKPNHVCYVLKDNNIVIGFIQALINKDEGRADLVNGGLDPAYHGKKIGASLYYTTFEAIFNSGISLITTNFCTQNTPVFRIKKALGFRFKDQEIHLRLIR